MSEFKKLVMKILRYPFILLECDEKIPIRFVDFSFVENEMRIYSRSIFRLIFKF